MGKIFWIIVLTETKKSSAFAYNFQIPNTGTIYVFENVQELSSRSFKLRAVAQESKSNRIKDENPATLGRHKPSTNSRYGNALINLGKLKDDGLESFAVGSPFEEEGKGAVYIYYGSQHFWSNDDAFAGIHISSIISEYKIKIK